MRCRRTQFWLNSNNVDTPKTTKSKQTRRNENIINIIVTMNFGQSRQNKGKSGGVLRLKSLMSGTQQQQQQQRAEEETTEEHLYQHQHQYQQHYTKQTRRDPSRQQSLVSKPLFAGGEYVSTAPKQDRSDFLALKTPVHTKTSNEFTTTDPTETNSCTSFSYSRSDKDDASNKNSSHPNSFFWDRDVDSDLDDNDDEKDHYHDISTPTAKMNHLGITVKTSPSSKANDTHVITIKRLSSGHLDRRDTSNCTLRLDTLPIFKAEQEETRVPTTLTPTKLKSLGTFDFPEKANNNTTCVRPTSFRRTSKSLGSGSFTPPGTEATSTSSFSNSHHSWNEAGQEHQTATTPTKLAVAASFTTPLSILSKGFQVVVDSTLALPRAALSFDYLLSPSHINKQTSEPPVPTFTPTKPRNTASDCFKMTQLLCQATRDCDYWNHVVSLLLQTHGKIHSQTAEALLQLGYAYMMTREYAQAVLAFQSACRIWKQLQRNADDHLALARVVDAVGMAWARVSEEDNDDHCEKSMTALEEAFDIRYSLLGPVHIDTVETLNKIASVHVQLREYQEAYEAYGEVYLVRKAIFGAEHPSVAVAAHALGNVLIKLASTHDAACYFQIAIDIYDSIRVPNSHPAVQRLVDDYKRLDRLCLTGRVPSMSTTTQ